MRTDLKQVLRKEVLALYAVVFIADTISGIVSPTFSLYAQSLGASLALIGALSGIVGLTRMLSSVPLGIISDQIGRKKVLSAGMLLFAVSSFLYTVVPSPYYLLPVRVIAGLGMVSTFFIGVAYVGDRVEKHQRGLAVGLYATCMGLGFAVGPIIGGQLVTTYGYRISYRVAALLAFVGFLIALRGLAPQRANPPQAEPSATPIALFTRLGLMVREPDLLAASVANLLIGAVFGGAILNFFPLYAASLSISEATLGAMFAARALISTLTRLPTGLLTTRIRSRSLMTLALGLAMVSTFAIARTTSPLALAILLAGEGIAFGMFLTAGQAFVTEHATDLERGTAIGVYGTAGSLGSTAGPFLLGLIAEVWGLTAVFHATAGLVLTGIGLLWYMRVRKRQMAGAAL